MEYEEALATKEKVKNELLSIEGVTGVGISTGSGPFLNIYVKKFTTEIEEKLPTQVDGMATRIIETGEIKALPLLTSSSIPEALDVIRTKKYRPES